MSGKKKKKEHERDNPAESGEPDEEDSAAVGGPVGGSEGASKEMELRSSAAAEAGEPVAPPPGGAAAQGPSFDRERTELEARITKLEAELAESADQLLRKHADFDNFRKRLARDKEEGVKFANTALLQDLILVIDGFERAIGSTQTSRDFDALHQGVVLIEKQLVDGLEKKWGLCRMQTVGTSFDPTLHQAVTMGGESEGGAQVVLEEYESGYMLNGRVLRPAKVKVSVPRRAAPESGAPAEPPSDGGNGRSGERREM